MSDVLTGIGATIRVGRSDRRGIIPAAIGVDIRRGMIATRLSLTGNALDEKRLKRVVSTESAAMCR